MSGGRKFQEVFVRILAVGLCLLAIQKAWAGVYYEEGFLAFKERNFDKASEKFERALRWDSANPRLLYDLGQSDWQIWLEKKDEKRLESSRVYFEKLTQELPYYGRGWAYRALVELTSIRQNAKGEIGREEWRDKILPLFSQAYEREPASAWMAYVTGTHLLAYSQFLSEEEKEEAFNRLKKSVFLRHPDKPSLYLKPALSFLWSKFENFELLKEVTPADAFSYSSLIELMDEKGLWAWRNEIWSDFRVWMTAAYEKQCGKAERFLGKKRFERALSEFQKAYWIDKTSSRAKQGMLIAQERMGQLPPDFKTALKEVLEEEEEKMGDPGDLLKPVVDRSGDPYLAGLYAVRRKEDAQAVAFFEKATGDTAQRFRRRFLAASLWRLGEKDKAIETLRPLLDESEPDLRELFLFKEWDSPFQKAVLEKIENVATLQRTPEDWWGWTEKTKGIRHRLNQSGRMGIKVNLKPGGVRLHVSLRSDPGEKGNYGYLLLRLWDGERERLIGTAYVPHKEWHEFLFDFKTTGGIRWLEAELFNGTKDPATRPGPLVEFGTVRVEYPQ